MRKYFFILLFVSACFGNDLNCKELYDNFFMVLEPQMTELCKTDIPGYYSYKFYIKDVEYGYINMNLVFTDSTSYLYIADDDNPFSCLKDNSVHKTENPKDILKILFIPKKDCTKKFKESIGIEF